EYEELATALSGFGIAAVPGLIGLLQRPVEDDNLQIKFRKQGARWGAALALKQIGREAKAAAPALVKVLEEEKDLFLAAEVTEALSRIGPRAVPLLAKTLKHKDWAVRTLAAMSLKNMGPECKAAMAELAEALKDEEWHMVRCHAADALGRIGVEAKQTLPALVKALKDPYWEVRCAAVRAVAVTGSGDKTATQTLT